MYVTELTHTHTNTDINIHTCTHNLLLFSLIALRVKAHYYIVLFILIFFFFCEFFVYVYKDEQLRDENSVDSLGSFFFLL